MKESDRIILEDLQGKLLRRDVTGVSIDSRTVKEGELFIALRGERFDGHDFVPDVIRKGAWGAVVERTAGEARSGALSGLPNVITVDDTLIALQELSRMHRSAFTLPVIAVTGTNGKTTTKEMLAAVLHRRGPVLKNEGNLNNHIGVPLTLLRLAAGHTAAVIEMGMSGLGEIGTLTRLAMPVVGVITNIGPAHLQFLGTADAVAQAKGELLLGMPSGGTAVLNADDRYFDALRAKFPGRIVSFGIERPADVRAADIGQQDGMNGFRLSAGGRSVTVRLRTVGKHNVANAIAAAAAAIALDVPLEIVKAGLEEFRPIALRSELREVQGRTVLVDCYNANPASVQAALMTLSGMGRGRRTVAVLGDMLELGPAATDAHREIGATAARLRTGLLITVGPLGHHIADGARQAGMDAERVFEAENTARAAALLRERSREGDVVLIKGSRGMKMETILEEP
jgi:UDP-N-acetylmuramoyl-tripeptide--D-alanyl-D-alanine ligase